MGSVIPGSWSTPEQKEEHQGSIVQHVEQLPLPSPGLRHRPGDEEAPLFNPNLPTNELLDECLERHHITGIAFAGTIGIGIFIFSGEILGLAGGLGAILSYLVAGGVVSSVMISLAEMVSVRPVVGAIFDFPRLYVDPALGFAVGIVYWMSYTTSFITLMVSGALIINSEHVAYFLIIPLVTITLINSFGGVRLYANAEWCFKWLKIIFLIGFDITMIILNIRGYPGLNGPVGVSILSNGLFPSGFNPNGTSYADPNRASNFNPNGTLSNISEPKNVIDGAFGTFLSIWTGIQLALFAFLGVEIVVVTAGEARYKKRDLPRASRRLYLWTIGFYVISIFLVALNVSFTDPDLLSYNGYGVQSSYSPFVIALNRANLAQTSALTSAATVGLVLAAWTTANTALYVASRTLHALFCKSTTGWLRRTIGSTSSGGTPLWAILVTLCPALLSFVAQVQSNGLLVLDTFGRIAVTCILCVYIAECLSFIRFKSIANSVSLNRKSPSYKMTYYRGPRQPFWAYFGLVSCSLLLIFNGWYTFYEINHGSTAKGDAAAGIIASYGGPAVFLGIIVFYKVKYRLPMAVAANVSQSFPTVADDPPYPVLRQPDNKFLRLIVRVLRAIR